MRSLYGRAARMRSCALRILDAATISIALVILRVFSTDLILPRISFPTAMTVLLSQECRGLKDQANDFLNAAMASRSSASAAWQDLANSTFSGESSLPDLVF